MKRLTKEQIQFIDDRLYNMGVEFIDIRYEMVDHIASELEAMEGDFGTNWTEYFIMHSNEIVKQNKEAKKTAAARAFKQYFNTLVSPMVFISAILIFTVILFYAKNYVDRFELTMYGYCILMVLLVPFAILSWKSKKISLMRAMTQIYTYIYLMNVLVPLTARIIGGRKVDMLWEQLGISLMAALMLVLIISVYRCRKQYVGKYI